MIFRMLKVMAINHPIPKGTTAKLIPHKRNGGHGCLVAPAGSNGTGHSVFFISCSLTFHHSGPQTSKFPTAIYPTESMHFQILQSIPLLSAPKQNLADARICSVKTLGPSSESTAKHEVGAGNKWLLCVLIWLHELRIRRTVSKTCPVLSKEKKNQIRDMCHTNQTAACPIF